jgi:Lrp/AsnC family leucine-responsive transcriptional regulator
MRIDQTDLRILKELQSNARISISALAKRVSLTPTPCARRVQQLESAGFIKAYVTLLDQALVGLPVNAFVEVRLVREGKAEIAEFESSVHGYPEVVECWAMSGGYDYLLRVVTEVFGRVFPEGWHRCCSKEPRTRSARQNPRGSPPLR